MQHNDNASTEYVEALMIEEAPTTTGGGGKKAERCSYAPIVAACVVITIVGAAGFKTGKYVEHANTHSATAMGSLALNMNMDVSPCDDMWTFACGAFEDTRREGNVLQEFGEKVRNAMIRNATRNQKGSQANVFYNACVMHGKNRANASSVRAAELWQRGKTARNVTFVKMAQLDEGRYNAILVADNIEAVKTVDVYKLEEETKECRDIIESVVGKSNFVATNKKVNDVCGILVNESGAVVPWENAEDCWSKMVEVFPRQVSIAYMEETAMGGVVKTVMDMAERIRGVFVATLVEGHFTELAEKVGSITIRMKDKIEPEHYPDYDERMSFAENEARFEMEQFRGGMQFFPEVYVNAFYMPAENAIHVTHAMLAYVQETGGDVLPLVYGKLGFVLAHEMAHSIDPMGVHYTGGGNYNRNVTIFETSENENKFAGDTTCLEKEYGTHGRTTNEDVADFIGMKVMIKVMEELGGSMGKARVCKEECREMDDMELFYTGFAQLWCRGAVERRGMEWDVHSGGKIRTEHVLKSANAQEAFGCREKHFNTCSVLGF